MYTDGPLSLGALENMRPTVNFANRMTAHSGQTWGPRLIPDWQLVYILSGYGELTIGGERYSLRPRHGLFYGPGMAHRLISDKTNPLRFTSVHFVFDGAPVTPVHPAAQIASCSAERLIEPIRRVELNLSGHQHIVLPPIAEYVSDIERLFADIVNEYRSERIAYELSLRGLMLQLLTEITRQNVQSDTFNRAQHKVAPALRALRDQPQTDWQPHDLARLCGYNAAYFAQLFKEAMGMSPKRYQLVTRIAIGKRLLLEGHTVEDTAASIGYSSVHYFSRQFKAFTGLTPTDFKLFHAEL